MKKDTINSFKYEGRIDNKLAEAIKDKLNLTADKNNIVAETEDFKIKKPELQECKKPKLKEKLEKSIKKEEFSPQNGKWRWIHCGDGCIIFTPPHNIEPLKVKNKYIKKHMGKYVSKYMKELPKFKWTLIQKGKEKRALINDERIIINSILDIARKEKGAQQKNLIEKAFVVRGRLSGIRSIVSISSTDLILKWEEVKFYDGYYVFKPNLEGKIDMRSIEPLRVENFRCRRSFNYIIKYFQARLPKIIYCIMPDRKIKLKNEPDFEAVLIDLAKEKKLRDQAVKIEHVTKIIHKLSFSEATSKGKEMTKEDFRKYKSQFIDFLVDHQTNMYKVVPITESISHSGTMHDEEGFIFTAKSNVGYLLIIVENVNPDRATMLFKVNEWHYKVALHTIFDYVQSDAVNKRSAIRDQNVSFREAGVHGHWTSNHDSFHDWKVRMLNDFM